MQGPPVYPMSGDINETSNFKSGKNCIMFLSYVLSFFKKGDTIQGGTLFKGGHTVPHFPPPHWFLLLIIDASSLSLSSLPLLHWCLLLIDASSSSLPPCHQCLFLIITDASLLLMPPSHWCWYTMTPPPHYHWCLLIIDASSLTRRLKQI